MHIKADHTETVKLLPNPSIPIFNKKKSLKGSSTQKKQQQSVDPASTPWCEGHVTAPKPWCLFHKTLSKGDMKLWKCLAQNSSQRQWHEFATKTRELIWIMEKVLTGDAKGFGCREGTFHFLMEELKLNHKRFRLILGCLVGHFHSDARAPHPRRQSSI